MTHASAQTSKAQDRARLKDLDAERAAARAVRRYRVDGVEVPAAAEPDWDALTPESRVEKYVYGAGWTPILPVKPVMAADVVRPTIREYMGADYKKRTETVYELEGPIWPPRNPS